MTAQQFAQIVGRTTLETCANVGIFTMFFFNTLRIFLSKKLKLKKVFSQINSIGVESIPIVILTGTFAGMVFAIQSYVGFERVGGEQFIGAIVALGMIRELGPVLTGLMVTGRAGSAIAAELGTMRITEQIDALRTLRINTFQYLVVPRILAGVLVLPLLSLFAMICGIVGGYVICIYMLQLSPEDYINNITTYVELYDITGGLIKSSVFGLILSWVGCYKGFYTTGGARGVGSATTQSVVLSSVLILILNKVLTSLLENI
jgi:phospholipid/cholesterol/gamma-HCH transport system permease protein